MKAFRFRGERVLDWYGKHVQLEEQRLTECIAARNAVQQALENLRAERQRVARELISRTALQAGDVAALEPYRIRAKEREVELIQKSAGCEAAIGTQRQKVQAARRRVRLLEKLRDRRHAEYVYLADRELEEIASESYLSRWQATSQEEVNRLASVESKPPMHRRESQTAP